MSMSVQCVCKCVSVYGGKGHRLDQSNVLWIKTVPQPRGPAFHTSLLPEGIKKRKKPVLGFGGAADASLDSGGRRPAEMVLVIQITDSVCTDS